MENEKDLLAKVSEAEKAGNMESLEQVEVAADLSGFDAVLEEITAAKARMQEAVNKSVATVESEGGTPETLQELVAPGQKEIEEVQESVKAEVAEVESIPVEPENNEKPTKEMLERQILSAEEILASWKDRMEKLKQNSTSDAWRSKKVFIAGVGEGTNMEFYNTYQAGIQENIDSNVKRIQDAKEELVKLENNLAETNVGGKTEKEESLESFTVPFEDHLHTIEIGSQQDFYTAAAELKKMGYKWNGGRDLMSPENYPGFQGNFKLIIEDNDGKNGSGSGKIVTYIRKGSTEKY